MFEFYSFFMTSKASLSFVDGNSLMGKREFLFAQSFSEKVDKDAETIFFRVLDQNSRKKCWQVPHNFYSCWQTSKLFIRELF